MTTITTTVHSPRTRSQTLAGPFPSNETTTESTGLQAAMREIHQLREERLQQQAQFESQLQQRDKAFCRMKERLRTSNFNQLSRSDCFNNECATIGTGTVEERSRDSINKELRFKVKSDIFDGTVPLRQFFSQFELIAQANYWSNNTKTVALVSCLRGKARTILEYVHEIENLDYYELKSKLELCFEESYLSQSYYSQFTNRKQKSGEDEATLDSEIERLSQLAYPESNSG